LARRRASSLLAVDFFTSGYRISGHVSTHVRSVADMLNDTLYSYLELQEVYISRISQPADIIATYAHAELRKETLLFAIVPIRESLSKAARSVSYFGRERLAVWLALPSFEIEGELQTPGMPFDLEAFLAERSGQYVAITDGVARPTSAPDTSFSGEALLVNQRCIDLFCTGKPSS
jgi:hypothetical protein